jgi:hypothetical protein
MLHVPPFCTYNLVTLDFKLPLYIVIENFYMSSDTSGLVKKRVLGFGLASAH